MAYKVESGQRVIVELTSGDAFEGDFINSNKNRIELINCINLHNNIASSSLHYFYVSEISNLRALLNDESTSTSSTDLSDQQTDIFSTSTLTVRKYNELSALVKEYIYMPVRDYRFFDALDTLSNAETIGVAILNNDYGRLAPIDILVLSTWNQIYLFDILLFNTKQFPKQIKYLFECDEIVKVAHDSRELVDCLQHQYDIKVNNIFDTYVASKMVSGESLSLPDCITKYFNISNTFTKEAMDPSLKSEWRIRPLDEDLRKKAARNVQYLIYLKTHLQKQLLQEFHQKVLKHSQSTLDEIPLEAICSLSVK